MKRFSYGRSKTSLNKPTASVVKQSPKIIIIPKVGKNPGKEKLLLPPPSPPSLFLSDSAFSTERSSSQTENFLVSAESRFDALDKRQRKNSREFQGIEKFKSKFELELANDYNPDYDPNTQAKVIQRAFRQHIMRLRLTKFVTLYKKQQNRSALLFFLAWRCAMKDGDVQKKSYAKFKKLYPTMLYVKRGRQFSPLRYFYVSERLFVPKNYDAETMYRFMKGMFKISEQRCFRLWALTTRNIKKHRFSLLFIRFTTKRLVAFGPTLTTFSLWSLYTKWVHREKIVPRDEYVRVRSKDVSIQWSVVEKCLNAKRRQIYRADCKYRTNLIKKTIKSIFNKSIEKQSEKQIRNNADNFAITTLMKKAHRGWLKFIEIKQKEHQVLRECVKGWYSYSYERAVTKTRINFFSGREQRYIQHHILNKWCLAAAEASVLQLRVTLNVQKHSSLSVEMFMYLLGRPAIGFMIECWRQWIKYTRRRRKWKRYCLKMQGITDATEKKYIVLYELKKIAQMRNVGATIGTKSLLPRGLGVSPELALLAFKEVNNSIIEEEKTHLFITNYSKTEKLRQITPSDFIRAVILFLNTKKNLEIVQRNVPKKDYFERYRTKEELISQINDNSVIFKNNLRIMLERNVATINAIDAHITAKGIPMFSTTNEPLYLEYKQSIEHNEKPIYVYEETQESIKSLLKQLEMAPPRLINPFKRELKETFAALDRRLREPSIIQGNKSNLISLSETANNIKGNISQIFRNPLIDNFHAADSSSTNHGNSSNNDTNSEYSKFASLSMTTFVKSYKENSIVRYFIRFISATTGIAINAKPAKDVGELPLLQRRDYLRNVKSFKMYTGLDKCIPAIIGLFIAMKKSKLGKYCGDYPFPEKYENFSQVATSCRYKIWCATKKKFPNIDVPEPDVVYGKKKNISLGMMKSLSNLSLSSMSLGSGGVIDLTSEEVYLSSFILPLVVPMESAFQFAIDEIVQ